jgi:uncharacterized protein YjbI with pentapeptide repeats
MPWNVRIVSAHRWLLDGVRTVKLAVGDGVCRSWNVDRKRKASRDEMTDRCAHQCVNLSGALLRGACFKRAALASAHLILTDLAGANLEECNLIDADMAGANLSYACLQGVDLTRVDLGPAELRDHRGRPTGRLWEASLQCADLRRAHPCGTRLASANLSDAKLELADLDAADLTGAKLPPGIAGEIGTSSR